MNIDIRSRQVAVDNEISTAVNGIEFRLEGDVAIDGQVVAAHVNTILALQRQPAFRGIDDEVDTLGSDNKFVVGGGELITGKGQYAYAVARLILDRAVAQHVVLVHIGDLSVHNKDGVLLAFIDNPVKLTGCFLVIDRPPLAPDDFQLVEGQGIAVRIFLGKEIDLSTIGTKGRCEGVPSRGPLSG